MSAAPPYDPHLRRETALAAALKARIRREGPLPVDMFMAACLTDPDHGYYLNRPAIGAPGDFVTAPEISQTFGELIGLWSAVVWQSAGAPPRVTLMELGPGRGTLLHDAVRATRIVPGFHSALSLRCVEIGRHRIEAQRRALAGLGIPVDWSPSVEDAMAGVVSQLAGASSGQALLIILANEYLDTLPARQLVRQDDGGWRERCVAIEARGDLCFCDGPTVHEPGLRDELDRRFARCRGGEIVELARIEESGLPALCRASLPGDGRIAGLFIDYGHARSAAGQSLQAVRAHRYEHPLTSPGEADLTVHVDFERFASIASATRGQGRQPDITVDGPVTQAEFLGRLGILERASRLIAANPLRANEIESGVARLMAPTGMGTRFKAIGVRSTSLPELPGLHST